MLPNNYEEFDWLDEENEVLDIMTCGFIGSLVEPNGIYGPGDFCSTALYLVYHKNMF